MTNPNPAPYKLPNGDWVFPAGSQPPGTIPTAPPQRHVPWRLIFSGIVALAVAIFTIAIVESPQLQTNILSAAFVLGVAALVVGFLDKTYLRGTIRGMLGQRKKKRH